jgi:hypothetical protein
MECRSHDRIQGKQLFKGGENSIVVYAINQPNGEPLPIQHIVTQRYTLAPFTSIRFGAYWGRNNLRVNVRDRDAVGTILAGLSVFRIGDDGKLTLTRKAG